MARPLFADTSYYVALLNRRDPLHAKASRLAAEFTGERKLAFVTTDTVLVETLTYLSRRGGFRREMAVNLVDVLKADPRVEIVAQTPVLFAEALRLYAGRSDKRYSMVDCISMVVMGQRRITEVLTGDRDFQQEGFTILL